MRKLIGYHTANGPASDKIRGQMFDYWTAGNGVWVFGERPDLFTAQFQIGHAKVKGLAKFEPGFDFYPPRLDAEVTARIFTEARREAIADREILFHLIRPDSKWILVIPEQTQSAVECRPVQDGPGSSHQQALIEIHSHHSMPARFSGTDDADETGLRIYGVVGRVLEQPEIRFRVGVYGHFWEIPAAWVADLPDDVYDCVGGPR